jgi:hypothetical protein
MFRLDRLDRLAWMVTQEARVSLYPKVASGRQEELIHHPLIAHISPLRSGARTKNTTSCREAGKLTGML